MKKRVLQWTRNSLQFSNIFKKYFFCSGPNTLVKNQGCVRPPGGVFEHGFCDFGSWVSCVSCPPIRVSCWVIRVSCLVSGVSCLVSGVSCRMSCVSYLVGRVSHFVVSRVWCLVSRVSCVVTPISCVVCDVSYLVVDDTRHQSQDTRHELQDTRDHTRYETTLGLSAASGGSGFASRAPQNAQTREVLNSVLPQEPPRAS